MSLYTIIKELQNASGSNAKIAILEANKDNELLKAYLRAVYDPAINYYQKKAPVPTQVYHMPLEKFNIEGIVHILSDRVITGHDAKYWLRREIETLDAEGQELVKLMIERSIGAGVGDTMILKVFPDLWFSVPYMRCGLMDEKATKRFSAMKDMYVQLKADGSFCYLVKEAGKAPEAITRAGSRYPAEFAAKLATGLPDDVVMIGELLVYEGMLTIGEPLPRKTGNGILNSVLKGGDIDDNLTFRLTVWDSLTPEEFKKGYSGKIYDERWNRTQKWVEKACFIEPIETYYVESLEEAYQIYSAFTEKGLEGAVLKNIDGVWKDSTSKDCIKLKIEFEVDLQVIGMTEGTGKAKGMMGSLTVASSDEWIVSDLGTGFTDEQRKAWWEMYSPETIQDYGIIVTVKANDIISKRDSKIASLFLPVFIEERLDKTEADSYARCVYQLEAAKNGGMK